MSSEDGEMASGREGDGEIAYIGLGSNLGDRVKNLERAVERLGRVPGIRVLRRSGLYETEPWGVADQPWFVNGVVEIETTLSPAGLLAELKGTEAEVGRQPSRRWGERLIDLDLLLFGGRSVHRADLVVPHPEMWNRLFVLAPLAELAPDLRGPDGRPMEDVVAALASTQMMRPLVADRA